MVEWRLDAPQKDRRGYHERRSGHRRFHRRRPRALLGCPTAISSSTPRRLDGSDIRFVADDDKTLLTFHIENFESPLSEAFVWVKVPDLKPGAPDHLLDVLRQQRQYRGQRPTTPRALMIRAPSLVYHFGEKAAPFVDSSGNSNNSKNAGVNGRFAHRRAACALTGHAPVTIPASAFACRFFRGRADLGRHG